jgi:hypothetical protein
VWGRNIDGQNLVFHLAGINNQNFLMRDDQTGSYWQQSSGRAISGPLRGRTLPFVYSDEISFKIWRSEQPQGRVLAPVAKFASQYETADWDKKVDKARVVISFPNSGLPMREQVFGIATDSASRAFPVKKVLSAKLVLGRVGDDPVLLVVAGDGLSVRAFRNFSPPRDFYRVSDDTNNLFTDAQTGSRWDFKGCAVDGPDQGRCLPEIALLKDYWFDWKNYHPQTTYLP